MLPLPDAPAAVSPAPPPLLRMRLLGLRRSGDEIEVHLGGLDTPDQLTPTYECWTIRREAWLPALPLGRRY